MFFVYALYNQIRNKIYIGQSNNIVQRLKSHNKKLPYKKGSYTSLNNGSWEIIYKEKYTNRIDALKRERQLKSQKGREYIWKLIKKTKYGGRSSTVERRPVEANVAGSNPVDHPKD